MEGLKKINTKELEKLGAVIDSLLYLKARGAVIQKVEEDTMKELKPCPFCGGSAVVKTTSNSVDHCGLFSQLHSVRCSKCGATTANTYKSEFRRDSDGFHVIHDGYEEAATDWNRRATE